MDYKKKYEEALEQARIYYDAESDTNVFLDCIFPELATSEDERISDTIFNCLYQCCDTGFISGKQRDDALAYLEKQKEHSMPDSTQLIEWWDEEEKMLEQKDFRNDQWRLAQNAYMDGFAKGWSIKQKEQKPADTDLADEIDKVSKQYPEVSFAKLSRIAKHFYDFGKPATPIVVEDTHRFCDDTLEAIGKDIEMREQHPELYPAEWSEEDNAFLKVAIAICNRYSHKDIANWLKSLRPSWKPSEEQMNALAHAINLDVYDAKRYGLDSLYNDLNKLREG